MTEHRLYTFNGRAVQTLEDFKDYADVLLAALNEANSERVRRTNISDNPLIHEDELPHHVEVDERGLHQCLPDCPSCLAPSTPNKEQQ